SNIRFPVAEIVIEGSNANSSPRQTVTRRRCKCAQRGRFAPDSLLEGNGFELQFLVARLSNVMGDGPAVPRSERICRGTERSNPSPSSRESGELSVPKRRSRTGCRDRCQIHCARVLEVRIPSPPAERWYGAG